MSHPRRDVVRAEVRSLLERAPAYGALPANERRQLAHDLVNVGALLAEPGWLTAKSQRGTPAATAMADLRENFAKSEPIAQVMKQTTGDGFTAGAVREGTDAFVDLVNSVDFSAFVSGLIQGVFQAIVDASIQQMQAYQSLLEAVVKSASQFGAENFSDGQAQSYLASTFPDLLHLTGNEGSDEGDGQKSRLTVREGANMNAEQAEKLGIERGADLSEPAVQQRALAHAKTALGQQRQQTLATLVMLGLNRIVVTNGRINAKVVFDLVASDQASHQDHTERDTQSEVTTHTSAGTGWAVPSFHASTSIASKVQTRVSSAVDNTSESAAEMKARLSGDVNIAFKSETFPLERLADPARMEVIQGKAGTRGTGEGSS